ncbi:Putative nuclease HARBI1 [Eumeta japonica]|uniref:Nuclease HARBI1 n=1 Tax=Eumeta variegata TaxID=151549 RepID=A0A4C1TIU6_EUMVA|nr:Putative nuclease HARBI1 [Eumeta japonica]
MERVIHKQLIGYLENNNIFPQLQSGFRKNRSTATGLLHITGNILEAQDNGSDVTGTARAAGSGTGAATYARRYVAGALSLGSPLVDHVLLELRIRSYHRQLTESGREGYSGETEHLFAGSVLLTRTPKEKRGPVEVKYSVYIKHNCGSENKTKTLLCHWEITHRAHGPRDERKRKRSKTEWELLKICFKSVRLSPEDATKLKMLEARKREVTVSRLTLPLPSKRHINNKRKLEYNLRLSREAFHIICDELRNTGIVGTRQISLELKVMTALSFYATGSYQQIIGASQHLAQQTISQCIQEVTNALNARSIIDRWIKFPTTQLERSIIKQQFMSKFGLPGVLGCIDCTHIALVRPTVDEQAFFNRKGYHSLNVQIVGDSGYPLRPWLLIPVTNAVQGSNEERYNRKHMSARNCVERCIGVLKARWRCLLKHRVLHYDPSTVSKIVTACCVLHNIAVSLDLPMPDPDADIEEYELHHEPSLVNRDIEGLAVLNDIISRL